MRKREKHLNVVSAPRDFFTKNRVTRAATSRSRNSTCIFAVLNHRATIKNSFRDDERKGNGLMGL